MKNVLIFLFTIIMFFSHSQEFATFFITDENDDATETGNYVLLNYEWIGLGQNPPPIAVPMYTGLRYQNITIPMGSEILSAYIQFYPFEDSNDTVYLRIRGEKSINAAPFENIPYSITSRPTTDATVNWTTKNWEYFIPGPDQKTPNLKEIINEIINQEGWASGNAVNIILEPSTARKTHVMAMAYEHDYGEWYAPQLIVEYIELSDIPEQFELSELSINPNPFTNSTTLSYELKQLSTVQLSIYNQLGQLVYHRSAEHQQGEQQLQWDAKDQTEGLYFYRLKAGDQVTTGKLVKN